MDKIYLKTDEVTSLSFPYDWKQSFSHASVQSKTNNEAMVLKLFLHGDFSKEEQQIGLEIIILLHEHVFATKQQMQRILEYKGYHASEKVLDAFLQKALLGRYLNSFTLSRYELDEIPEDAFLVYCLDHGSMWILKHFYDNEIDRTWRGTNPIRGAEQVSKFGRKSVVPEVFPSGRFLFHAQPTRSVLGGFLCAERVLAAECAG